MLPENLELEIVTPERHMLDETVDYVEVPGKEGYMGILPGHAPLLSELGMGTLFYRKGGQSEYFAALGGFVEVLPGRVIVLADACERASEINVERAREAFERAKSELSKGGTADKNTADITLAMERAQARLEAASKAGAVATASAGH
ncbi:MAG TPA: F0F1 ATP synthase subunit epsilon [Candidatus Acidoferrales bacterium]|nr:F0F1 ATP synthase subunit epsilon [Candidatus Acidoferrales bacterium]